MILIFIFGVNFFQHDLIFGLIGFLVFQITQLQAMHYMLPNLNDALSLLRNKNSLCAKTDTEMQNCEMKNNFRQTDRDKATREKNACRFSYFPVGCSPTTKCFP